MRAEGTSYSGSFINVYMGSRRGNPEYLESGIRIVLDAEFELHFVDPFLQS